MIAEVCPKVNSAAREAQWKAASAVAAATVGMQALWLVGLRDEHA